MSDEEARESLGAAERARRDINVAFSELNGLDKSDAQVVPESVAVALRSAKSALAAERTECRKQTPYSALMLVGDSHGLRYVCSHQPTSHEYPL
jgi:hypothetical protein